MKSNLKVYTCIRKKRKKKNISERREKKKKTIIFSFFVFIHFDFDTLCPLSFLFNVSLDVSLHIAHSQKFNKSNPVHYLVHYLVHYKASKISNTNKIIKIITKYLIKKTNKRKNENEIIDTLHEP